MKFIKNLAIASCLSLSSGLALASDLEGISDTGTPEEIQETLDGMELVPRTVQSCYSARRCRGKVLSHRDQHNCKVKSKGKSWRSYRGQCYNL